MKHSFVVFCICTIGALGCMSPLPGESSSNDLHNQPQGAICGDNAQCLSGFCVDGRCCDKACNGVCEACNLGGSLGVCQKILAGNDPAHECIGDGTTCTGTCNGAGACQYPQSGLACIVPTDPLPRRCDGLGHCVEAPFLTNGQPCDPLAANQCESGFCVDGYCCDSACTGTCKSCKLAGMLGTCQAIPAGTDPESDCLVGGDLQCEGKCSGNNSCIFPPTGTVCQLADSWASSCNGAGTCLPNVLFPNGTVCTAAAQCLSDFCVDGVCCDSDCAGFCRTCNMPGQPAGHCLFYSPGTDPENECKPANQLCDGLGKCTINPQKLANGSTCFLNTDCVSGFCTEGVCCDDGCGGACRSCKVANNVGHCMYVPLGSNTKGAANGGCAGTDATCGGTCDGAGACTYLTATTPCVLASSPIAACNGAGACTDARLPDGMACNPVTDHCVSGHCVDGVCCDSACGGLCVACTAVKTGGADGACLPVLINTDPDNECLGGNDLICGGTCDGAMHCQYAAKSTPCAGGNVCDGLGNCGAVPTLPNGSICTVGGTACTSGNCVDGYCCDLPCQGICMSCNIPGKLGACSNVPMGDTDTNIAPAASCLSPSFCNALGACVTPPVLKANGVACDPAAGDCASQHCIDGVCCDTACAGTCMACNLTTPGTCSPIPVNTDPASECQGNVLGDGPCDGTCSGAGSCQYPLAGTVCATLAVPSAPGTCNGLGDCIATGPAPVGQPCNGPGQCASGNCVDGYCCDTACAGTCMACNVPGELGTCSEVPAGVADLNTCASPQVCNGLGQCAGVSVPLVNGTACGSGPQCASGFCVDGVCCDTVCAGTCQACTAAKVGPGGVTGTCGLIGNNLDPDNECPGNDAICGGTCNGDGGCKVIPAGTACTGGTCSGATGVCVPTPTDAGVPPQSDAAPRSQDAGTACFNNNQCVGGVCNAGLCEYQVNGSWPFWVDLPTGTSVTMVHFWPCVAPFNPRDVTIVSNAAPQEFASQPGECAHTEDYPGWAASCSAVPVTFPTGAPSGSTRISKFGDNRLVPFCILTAGSCPWGGTHDGVCKPVG